MWKGPEYPGDFPSLGYLLTDWIEAHCVIPDGFRQGEPFVLSEEQQVFVVRHYRLKESAQVGQLAPAFKYRRSQLVRPQKWGKAPLTAAMVCGEGVGPVLFAGWAGTDDGYVCADHGCSCGWEYAYEPGEPMGMLWPTPLIQITATSEEQTDNIYAALRPMIDDGPLHELIPKTGEEFIRLPRGGRIDTVTSSARSRLGQRVTFVVQDETGFWTAQTKMIAVAETQRRGLAGMGGRAVETTNTWDPTEKSVAQRTAESKATDIYRDHRPPPAHLSYRNKRERRKIHQFNYQSSPWVDLDAIEAEAAELMETDPAQAERFFGNRVVVDIDRAFDLEKWIKLADPRQVVEGSLVTVGVDGARFEDALAIVATTLDGYQWPLGIWERPEDAPEDYEHPADEIDRAMIAAFDTFSVWRAYVDPQWIDHLFTRWQGRWTDKVVRAWYTNRDKPVAYMLRNFRQAITAGDVTHDGDPTLAAHVGNARRRRVGVLDEQGRRMWTITKQSSGGLLKIDGAMAAALSWEARGDAVAAGAEPKKRYKVAGF